MGGGCFGWIFFFKEGRRKNDKTYPSFVLFKGRPQVFRFGLGGPLP